MSTNVSRNTGIGERSRAPRPSGAAPFVLPFAALDRGSLAIVGGKGANLGELTRAGLPVPPGFCVTTAAYTLVAATAGLEPTLSALAETPADDADRLAELARAARTALLSAPMPDAVAADILAAYRDLDARTTGDGRQTVADPAPPSSVDRPSSDLPVAVRSSATAEDLPTASFAGQQGTYLNIVGSDALLDAVRRCWASLWTDRAVTYRAANRIDHAAVRLAVVVQRMVEARAAGVLFTANPLTGRRRQAVIDASPGLGEAVVSGAVNPDRFVVETATGEIVERRLGDKRVAVRSLPGGGTERVELPDRVGEASLSDAEVRQLAALGARVEAHYGAPQDIEFAIDADGTPWLTQARPITTLFPLPADAPISDADLRVYFSFSVAQGVFRPLTPMGIQGIRLMASGIAATIGRPPRDQVAGPAFIVELAHRLFFDVTPLVRHPVGRRILLTLTRNMEARSNAILSRLMDDPRLPPAPARSRHVARVALPILARTQFPLRMARALLRPAAARAGTTRAGDAVVALGRVAPDVGSLERLTVVERMLLATGRLLPRDVMPVAAAGLGSGVAAGALLGHLATGPELETIRRALPHNPTTEMDLRLWQLAQRARADAASERTLRETPPDQLARQYAEGALPPTLQAGLAEFLQAYGHRGVAEIDLGLPRWSEDPTHILGVLANYLRLDDPARAPDAQFRTAAREAEVAATELARRARRRSPLRGALVRFLLRRSRALSGIREAPKFHFVRVLAQARALLRPVGEELAAAGRLAAADDIYFVTLPEARAGLGGTDLRALVAERRATYERELHRRHIPHVLLSDGTEPTAEAPRAAAADANTLVGAPASAGLVTAPARVILDPSGAHLEPGEILVAPSTDPGWTPLFLTAGGLVMEMGGGMSHGAVVAREYGIPAVVGVPAATERITTGQRITVNGTNGVVRLVEVE
jgi:pyruvate,water dikinase